MGGLFEVIIIERRASQRAETLGNKPAQPSDYQMEISQRKPTLAGEDRAQADGPRKTPQAARQLTVPRADSLWGRVSDWCGSLNSSISLPAKFRPPQGACATAAACSQSVSIAQSVSQSAIGSRRARRSLITSLSSASRLLQAPGCGPPPPPQPGKLDVPPGGLDALAQPASQQNRAGGQLSSAMWLVY